MKITVTVKAGAKVEKVECLEGKYRVSVKAPPTDGKANVAVIKALARHFKIPQTRVNMISGFTSKNKRLEIL
jgi:uncharacterized protein (TIGR00251 family)